jgi:hypothetical protein
MALWHRADTHISHSPSYPLSFLCFLSLSLSASLSGPLCGYRCRVFLRSQQRETPPTAAQDLPGTALPLYPSTPLPLYPSIPLPLYPSTLSLFPSTLLPLYPSTLLPFYPIPLSLYPMHTLLHAAASATYSPADPADIFFSFSFSSDLFTH